MKKHIKQFTSVGLAIALLLGLFVSTHPASADAGYTLNFTVADGYTMSVAGSDGIQVAKDAQNIGVVTLQSGGSPIGEANCNSTTDCSIVVSDDTTSEITFNGSAFSLRLSGELINPGHTFNSSQNLYQLHVEDPQSPSQPTSFSGIAYFVWDCAGNLCKASIDNIPASTIDGDIVHYHTRYIPAADVSDGNYTVNIQELNASGHYYWVWNDGDGPGGPQSTAISLIPQEITSWSAFSTWFNENFEGEEHYDALKAFAIDPTGAESGHSTITTNGDREFRATIYDEDSYFGISNASSPDDLTYYPAFWDPAFFNPTYDISGTSLEDPWIIQSYLLEPQVTISSDSNFPDEEIASIVVASDNVPSDAVDIVKNNTNNTFDLTFHSNYYDKVVFRVTTTAGREYYFALARVTFARFIGNDTLFVPEDDQNTYDVRATFVFSDGTTSSFNLEPTGDSGPGGKGLKAIFYEIPTAYRSQIDFSPSSTNPPTDAYFTVIKSGSTSTSYSGTLAGSGAGTHYRVINGNYKLDISK